MQSNFASHQLANIAEPSVSSNEENLEAAMNFEIAEDQLSRFMTRAMTIHASPSPGLGSFADCKARFSGTGSNKEIQSFLLNITLYKDAERIKDDTALKELPLLLEGEAATWWTQVKENVYSWSAAMQMIKEKFTPKRPAYQVYAEIFNKQDGYTPTEIFIRQKQALFAELSRPHPEDVQIDMIYSLLQAKIQHCVLRDSVFSMEQLIDAANCVERSRNERRAGKYRNINIQAAKIASTLRERCSKCRKAIKSGQMKSDNVDCSKCNLRRAERNKGLTPETTNRIYAPLQGFDPNINPFSR